MEADIVICNATLNLAMHIDTGLVVRFAGLTKTIFEDDVCGCLAQRRGRFSWRRRCAKNKIVVKTILKSSRCGAKTVFEVKPTNLESVLWNHRLKKRRHYPGQGR